MKNIKINVEGMKCHHCKNAVESELMSISGISSVVAEPKNNLVTVEYDESTVSVKNILDGIEEAGYTPKEYNQ